MVSKKSCEICSDTVQKYLDNLDININEERILEEELSLKEKGLSYLDLIKGHFLFSAVKRFIRVQAKNMNKKVVTISQEMFYSNMISVFQNVFNEGHPHYKYYKDSFSLIKVND